MLRLTQQRKLFPIKKNNFYEKKENNEKEKEEREKAEVYGGRFEMQFSRRRGLKSGGSTFRIKPEMNRDCMRTMRDF